MESWKCFVKVFANIFMLDMIWFGKEEPQTIKNIPFNVHNVPVLTSNSPAVIVSVTNFFFRSVTNALQRFWQVVTGLAACESEGSQNYAGQNAKRATEFVEHKRTRTRRGKLEGMRPTSKCLTHLKKLKYSAFHSHIFGFRIEQKIH